MRKYLLFVYTLSRGFFQSFHCNVLTVARQSHKTCIVLSGNDVVVWRNAKKAFVHLANKVFGVKVGYFDLQVRFRAILYGFVKRVSEINFFHENKTISSLDCALPGITIPE